MALLIGGSLTTCCYLFFMVVVIRDRPLGWRWWLTFFAYLSTLALATVWSYVEVAAGTRSATAHLAMMNRPWVGLPLWLDGPLVGLGVMFTAFVQLRRFRRSQTDD